MTVARQKILVTGGSGFVGTNALPLLRDRFDVLAPRRQELDISDAAAVECYVKEHRPDAIVHLANPNPAKNPLDEGKSMFEGSLNSFMACYRCRSLVNRVVYLGSGAEFDKSLDIASISEEEFGRSYPSDQYGAAKYIENELARSADNVINLRLFACYGPGDHWTKFITHCIRCVLAEADITIRQDCYFDYLHVSDLAKILCWSLESNPAYSDYNVASGVRVKLSDIARMVCEEMASGRQIMILTDGLNKEYTASVERLRGEYINSIIAIRDGIRAQIDYERSVYPEGGYDQI